MPATKAGLVDLWESMVMARAFDQAMSAHNSSWHEARGEEGVIVGAFSGLAEDDVVVPHFRGACAVAILRGEEPASIAAGVFGKAVGPVRGAWRGDVNPAPSKSLIGMFSGTLGTTVSYAAGAALRLKLIGSNAVAVCSFGDGTANAGIVNESMNLAAMLTLPLVLFCQDNQYATSLPSSVALAGGPVSVRARAFGLASIDVDGNDVSAVREAQLEAVARARSGGGPTLVHALTYRMGGHYMNDPETYRSQDEVAEWQQKDPIVRAQAALIAAGELDAESAHERSEELRERMDQVVRDARSARETDPKAILSDAFAQGEEAEQ